MSDKKVVEICVHPWPYPYHAGRFIFCGKCGGELELVGDGRDAADHLAEVDRLTKEVEHYAHHSHEWAKKSVEWMSKFMAAEQRISELTTAFRRLCDKKDYTGYPVWFNLSVYECPDCDSEDLCTVHLDMAEHEFVDCETEIGEFIAAILNGGQQ